MNQDIWVITCYFNPCGYKTRRRNFARFRAGMRAVGANLLVVEMASSDQRFELPPGPNVVRFLGDDYLWQKECLLGLAFKQLPAACTKVVWLDCDVLFEDSAWLTMTSAALDRFAVVQPFSTCVRLPQGHTEYCGEGKVYESFASVYARNPASAHHDIYLAHGHTGFAWAARREVLERCGLYDVCLTASADHLMAHAFAGALSSPCIASMLGEGRAYDQHFRRWAEEADRVVQSRLGHVAGRLLHLWHGEAADRRYAQRNQEFRNFDFNPARDIERSPTGAWMWAEASGAMREWALGMFWSRKEDGSNPDP